MKFSEAENCTASIAGLKKYLRQYLGLDEAYCILISSMQDRDVTETVIMIENMNGAGMRIFKAPESVRNISIEDIPDILCKPFKQKLIEVCMASVNN